MKIGSRCKVTNGGCNYSSSSIMDRFPASRSRISEFVGVFGSLKNGSTGTVVDKADWFDEGLYLIELDDGSGLYAVSGDGLAYMSTAKPRKLEIDSESILALIQN